MPLRYRIVGCILLLLSVACHREGMWSNATPVPFMENDAHSVDSLLSQMSLAEKVGQLLLLQTNMTGTCSEDSLYNHVRTGKIGSMILDQQSVSEYLRIRDNCQAMATIPLLFGTDQNVSLCNQFTDTPQFPKASTIAAIGSDSLQHIVQSLYIKQCQALDIHFSFAPNIEKNQAKDVYKVHTFEQHPELLRQRAENTVLELQHSHILAYAQSFDRLVYMPNDTLGVLDSILYTPKQLTQKGLSGWQVSPHIFTQDSIQRFIPSYLKDYLYHQIDFGGLVIGKISAKVGLQQWLHAGADLFWVNEDIEKVYNNLYQLARTGILPQKVLDAKVRKILLAKQWALGKKEPTPRENVEALLQNPHYEHLIRQLYQQSVILAHNEQALPFNYIYRRDFQVFHYKNTRIDALTQRMEKYAAVRNIPLEWISPPPGLREGMTARLLTKKRVARQLQGLEVLESEKGTKILVLDQQLTESADSLLYQTVNALAATTKVILINFGNPYNATFFDKKVSLIQVFEKNDITEHYVAELLFGGRTAWGRLPLAINEHLPFGTSHQTAISRLNFATPQEQGIAPEKLVGIDAIVQSAIRKRATPGAQVLVVHKGSVVYNKAFGYHTYTKQRPVEIGDLYDIASLTKTTATTLAAMKLYDADNFDLEDRLKTYFDDQRYGRFGRIKLKHLLTHYSRLQANMPIYPFIKDNVLSSPNDCNDFFCGKKRNDFGVKIADNVYAKNDLKNQLWKEVLKIKPYKRYRYRYSDVNFNILQKVIEQKVGTSLDDFLYQKFYRSLNMQHCLYRPLTRFERDDIVPTALDQRWRKQTLHGYVHDESAALLGGVAGNAGLFSNAQDLAVLYQMLLNGGTYGNYRYLKPETIQTFTQRQRGSSRGLGFDRVRKTKTPSYSSKASSSSYGHTGFTGTAVWVDPEKELIYIFLSNRIHPDPYNTKLFKGKTRRRIHDVIYNALETYQMELPL